MNIVDLYQRIPPRHRGTPIEVDYEAPEDPDRFPPTEVVDVVLPKPNERQVVWLVIR